MKEEMGEKKQTENNNSNKTKVNKTSLQAEIRESHYSKKKGKKVGSMDTEKEDPKIESNDDRILIPGNESSPKNGKIIKRNEYKNINKNINSKKTINERDFEYEDLNINNSSKYN